MATRDPDKHRAQSKASYLRRREAILAKMKAASTPESRAQKAAYTRAHYTQKREAILQKKREKEALMRDEINAKMREWRAKNPEKVRGYQVKNNRNRAEERRAANKRRKAMLRGVAINDLTAADWNLIKAHYGYRCVYCGRKMQRLTQDHLIPIIQGGNHTLSNVVPACQSCNSRKKAGPPLKPVQPLLL